MDKPSEYRDNPQPARTMARSPSTGPAGRSRVMPFRLSEHGNLEHVDSIDRRAGRGTLLRHPPHPVA